MTVKASHAGGDRSQSANGMPGFKPYVYRGTKRDRCEQCGSLRFQMVAVALRTFGWVAVCKDCGASRPRRPDNLA